MLKVRSFALFVEALRPEPLLWWFASASSVGFGSLGAALGFLCSDLSQRDDLPESGLFTFWQRLRLASGIWKMLIFCFYKNFCTCTPSKHCIYQCFFLWHYKTLKVRSSKPSRLKGPDNPTSYVFCFCKRGNYITIYFHHQVSRALHYASLPFQKIGGWLPCWATCNVET